MYVYVTLYLSSVHVIGYLSCLFLGYHNKYAAMNISVQISLKGACFKYFGYVHRSV